MKITMSDQVATPIDRQAVQAIADRSETILASPDWFEGLVEPAAKFAQALERSMIAQLRDAARVLLTSDTDLKAIAPAAIESLPPDGIEAVETLLNQLQAELKKMHDSISAQLQFAVNPEVREMAASVQASMTSLYEHVEHLRWIGREVEADADIATGRVKKFGNAAAAIAHLRRSTR